MYQLYLNSESSRGSLAEVWIDKEDKLVKKYYKPNAITIKNKPPMITDLDEIKKMYDRERKWLTVLKSKYVVELYEAGSLKNEPGWYMIQEYYGPTLLDYYSNGTLHTHFPNIKEQITDLFKFFQKHNVYKFNNAMANLTGNDAGEIKAIDFKYMEERSLDKRENECYSVDTWLSKINPELKTILREYI